MVRLSKGNHSDSTADEAACRRLGEPVKKQQQLFRRTLKLGWMHLSWCPQSTPQRWNITRSWMLHSVSLLEHPEVELEMRQAAVLTGDGRCAAIESAQSDWISTEGCEGVETRRMWPRMEYMQKYVKEQSDTWTTGERSRSSRSKSRSEATGAARSELSGSKRPSTRPRGKDIREQRPDAALDVLAAGNSTSTGGGAQDSTLTGSTRHVDRSINSSMSASRSARWPRGTQPQRRQLRRVATTELRRDCSPEAEAGESQTMATNHDRPTRRCSGRADSCRAAIWDDLRRKAGRGGRTTVDDRGKQSWAKPDERRSVQTFEAEAPATRCSQRRTRVATDTAWRSTRPAWSQRPPHAQHVKECAKENTWVSTWTATLENHGVPWGAIHGVPWRSLAAHGVPWRPQENSASPWQTKAPHCKRRCVRRSRGETDALAKQRRRGANTAQVRSLSEREQMDDLNEKKLKERTYSW